jgi:hypothetical protein
MNFGQNTRVTACRAGFLALLGAAALAMLVSAAPARAALSLTNASVTVSSPDGTFSRQAGAHPDLIVQFDFPHDPVTGVVEENVRDVRVDLPAGMVGDPTVAPQCPARLLVSSEDQRAHCPPESQIGVALVGGSSDPPAAITKTAVFNMEHSSDVPGLFAFNFLGVPVFLQPQVRPADYGISSQSAQISQTLIVNGTKVTIWGVPADARHAPDRFDLSEANRNIFDLFGCGCETNPLYPWGARSAAPRTAFLSAPTSCPGTPSGFTFSADSWQAPGVFDVQSFTSDAEGTPLVTERCDKLAFDPEIAVQPTSHVADAPTGVDVNVTVPQNDSPDGLATAHVKRVEVTFPEGMSVSPSSAAGLGACAPSQIGIGTDSPVSCPDSSRLGTVEIHTPLLDDRLQGDVFLAKQDDNPFRSLIALYMVAKGPGFTVKLPGKVDLDPRTGRVVATFDNTPQVPFDELHVHFRGGSQGALATPPTCGTYRTHTGITSWASAVPVESDSPMVIDEGCDARPFAPSLGAGTDSPAAGADAPFTLTVTRADRTQYLGRVGTTLPAGLLARIGSVPLCPEDRAAAGSCDAASQIGSVAVQAGPGALPLPVTGRVYLTGAYRGGPFGLSIVVPTAGQAGPFDLGNVVVRAAIRVDRVTAQASVESDPLPSIIAGVPLRIREARVTIDRPGFTFNPTSCTAKTIQAELQSLDGAAATLAVPFQALGCGDLGFAPRLSMSLAGKGQTTDGKHPTLNAHLAPVKGDANSRRVTVALPLSLALDPDNANGLCEPVDAAANRCPAASVVGRAKAFSVLPDPLTGPVYFVRGERKDPKSGRTIKTLPKLFIPLSADGVTIYVNAASEVRGNRLVTTFDNLPDAPFTSFDLQINGGKHGILTVSGADVCSGTQIADAQSTGQNGKVFSTGVTMGTPCALGIVKSSHTSTALKITVGGVGAGKLRAAGRGLVGASRTIGSATTTTLTLKLSRAVRRALAHRRDVRVKVTVLFTPKGAKKARRAVKTVVLHGAAKR